MSLKSNSSRGMTVRNRRANVLPICDPQMLQYAQPGKNGECELVIGLDFGTSSTKVVIQAPDLPGCPSYSVNFGRFSSGTLPHLLPTRLWIAPSSGLCTLAPRDGYIMVNNIKLELFSKDENLYSSFGPIRQQLPPEETAVCYLALLLRYSRRWFLKTKPDLLQHFSRIRWSMNMGVPSPCIEDNEENLIFRRVGKAAWWLSTLVEDYITLDKAGRELKFVSDTDYWDTDEEFACDFEIIPEIAAGAVGYALSDLRREGLHVMVDIGASTVDVCSFLLQEREGNDRYSLLISDVQQLGSIRLYNDRIVAFKQVYEDHVKDLLNKHDPMVPLDEDIKPYLISKDQFITAFEKAREQLKEQFLRMVRRVIWQTKLRRTPDTPIWREGRLPILLIGGGSKLQFFRLAVEALHDWLKYYTRNDGIIILNAPIPDSLTDSIKNAEEYQLFAVAWGLSHRSMDIGEIIPADQIPDIEPPPPLNWRKRYVGKELV
jgi:hypothetical protein